MGEAKRRAARGEMPYQRGGRNDRDPEVRKLAAEMDQRVRQLTTSAPSISDRALTEQMLGFLPGLHQIWTTTSDDTLANLCSEYPGFYRYAKAMEEAFEAQRKHPDANPIGADIQELPDGVKPVVARVMTQGAALERELQNLLDAFQRHATLGVHADAAAFGADVAKARDVAQLHQQWIANLNRMTEEAHAAGVSPASRQLLAKVLGDVNARIDTLSTKLTDLALAGRAAAKPGADKAEQ
jgi:hypothetical protein